MKTTHPLFPACLLAVGLLMQSCATTDDLYARYECGKCTTRVLVASSSVSASSVSRLRWSPAVYFAFDAASLPAAERERLEANLDVLRRFPDAFVLVRGFTDSFGSKAYNEALATRRVGVIRNFLADRGLDPARVRVAPVGETGFLRASNAEADDRAANRRVEMLLVDARNMPYRLAVDSLDPTVDAPYPGDEGNRERRAVDEIDDGG